MRSAFFLIVSALVANWPGGATVLAAENGDLAVYADQFEGRPTASGAPYEAAKLSAAHASLPFGTLVRVANFETGRMVDVVINDRKGHDGRLITLSRSAAAAVQLPANRVAPGSLLVIQGGAAPAAGQATASPARAPIPPAPASSAAGEPQSRKFKPFSGIFGKEAAPLPSAGAAPVQYGIPASQYDSRFAGTVASRAAAGPMAGRADMIPMNAVSPVASLPSSRQAQVQKTAPPSPSASMHPAASPAAPYRVQFGAFRRVGNANELAGMLGSAGIPSDVYASPGTNLNLVVTRGGFVTAEEAQRWIDFEGARRGWVDRPVVIR